MDSTIEKLNHQVLKPKMEQLISQLMPIVNGDIPIYIPAVSNPQYFEIWFDFPFEFTYTVIGIENYSIYLKTKYDEETIEVILTEFKSGYRDEITAEQEFFKIQRELEFVFFADCWEELERRVNRGIRCFLIEDNAIRGIDVNKRVKIDGGEVSNVLAFEKIPNHYGSYLA